MRTMKHEKTGLEVLGSRLFAGQRTIPRLLSMLPRDLASAISDLEREHGVLPSEHLRRSLVAAFDLKPLQIGPIEAIRIELAERGFRSEYGSVMTGHLIEAIVPYVGSAKLWKARLVSNFAFGLPGIVGPSAVRLRMFQDHKHIGPFEDFCEKELAKARSMLASADDTIGELSREIHRQIDAAIEQYEQ